MELQFGLRPIRQRRIGIRVIGTKSRADSAGVPVDVSGRGRKGRQLRRWRSPEVRSELEAQSGTGHDPAPLHEIIALKRDPQARGDELAKLRRPFLGDDLLVDRLCCEPRCELTVGRAAW